MIIKYSIIFAVIIVFLLISFVFYAEVKQNIDKYRKSIGYDKNKLEKKKDVKKIKAPMKSKNYRNKKSYEQNRSKKK